MAITRHPPGTSVSRSDTYTATGNGVTVDVSGAPLSKCSIQVTGTGSTATVWDVRLQGSLDGITWTQILQHVTASGNGQTIFSGAGLSPFLFFRSRCAGLTLGLATNIVVVILGMN